MSSKLFLALASILSLAASLPHTPRECSQAAATPGVVAHPQHFNIYQSASQPDHPTDNVPHLDLHTNITRQVVVFAGIPATAETCALGWRQGPVAPTRVFRVDGSGLVSSRQLAAEGFPTWTKGGDVRINPTTIAPFREGGGRFSAGMDFTFWDRPEFSAPATHAGPSVRCGERIVVELAVNLDNGQDGRVFMQDDAENGLFISYS
ncbi:hypothetical protein CTA2_3544 [Colletotrichum tanaceti]|uniref:Ubiquitin 3 binding protein But2 C-terminal domain-containing protein n=1 Tax=Colletotrichum tanaceti TaxID=1306861 RepID=A0A4V6DK71_9PEZI|nr:hypothetical protein CTA2_3544 [Colletotrichum tanaceti]TKW58346.1 hypothetical protein CTA1_5194 [Colletotrichum tanaceti]